MVVPTVLFSGLARRCRRSNLKSSDGTRYAKRFGLAEAVPSEHVGGRPAAA
jgi:hypothetical protein